MCVVYKYKYFVSRSGAWCITWLAGSTSSNRANAIARPDGAALSGCVELSLRI